MIGVLGKSRFSPSSQLVSRTTFAPMAAKEIKDSQPPRLEQGWGPILGARLTPDPTGVEDVVAFGPDDGVHLPCITGTSPEKFSRKVDARRLPRGPGRFLALNGTARARKPGLFAHKPQFREQGVAGSNPAAPTNEIDEQGRLSGRPFLSCGRIAVGNAAAAGAESLWGFPHAAVCAD